MKSEKLAEKINTDIAKWAKDKDKLVVAIDGYTGIGKTTILDHLEKINPDILAVHQDDFGLSRKKVKALLKNTYDRSVVFELRNRDLKKIARLVKLFRSGRNKSYSIKTYNYKTGKIDSVKKFDLSKHIFVIEGIFMFHPKLLNHLWDKRIYLEGNTKIIDKRRIKREKRKWGKDYFPETHPDSYFRQVIIALKRYERKYKPKLVADLVLKVNN